MKQLNFIQISIVLHLHFGKLFGIYYFHFKENLLEFHSFCYSIKMVGDWNAILFNILIRVSAVKLELQPNTQCPEPTFLRCNLEFHCFLRLQNGFTWILIFGTHKHSNTASTAAKFQQVNDESIFVIKKNCLNIIMSNGPFVLRNMYYINTVS